MIIFSTDHNYHRQTSVGTKCLWENTQLFVYVHFCTSTIVCLFLFLTSIRENSCLYTNQTFHVERRYFSRIRKNTSYVYVHYFTQTDTHIDVEKRNRPALLHVYKLLTFHVYTQFYTYTNKVSLRMCIFARLQTIPVHVRRKRCSHLYSLQTPKIETQSILTQIKLFFRFDESCRVHQVCLKGFRHQFGTC